MSEKFLAVRREVPTMKQKRHTAEEIIHILRAADQAQSARGDRGVVAEQAHVQDCVEPSYSLKQAAGRGWVRVAGKRG